MGLASFCWLIWVPFVTAWTWRLFLNPTSVFEEGQQLQQPQDTKSDARFTLILERYISVET